MIFRMVIIIVSDSVRVGSSGSDELLNFEKKSKILPLKTLPLNSRDLVEDKKIEPMVLFLNLIIQNLIWNH